MNEILTRKIARRTFLKAAAATGAVAAVGDKLFGGPVAALVESKAATAAVTEDKWVTTVCDRCDQNCGIMVHVVDGIVADVKGYPYHAGNHGKICGQPNTYSMYLYNPYRVKAPMKRTNPEKGLGVDPQWVEISWQEALDTVGAKLKAVYEKDPHGYWIHNGHREVLTIRSDFRRVFGTINALGSVNFCTGGANHIHKEFYLADPGSQCSLYGDKLVIEIGGRFYSAKGNPTVTRQAVQMKEQGCKWVYIAPVIAPSHPNPDEWLPVKVGTDAAFALAMCHVMVHELGADYPGYDIDFLKTRTNAPYLIKPDGLYMRAEGTGDELIEDESRLNTPLGKPLMWDPVDGKPKVYDDPSFQDFALEGTFTVQWKDMEPVECKTAFTLFKEHVAKYTPEYAEGICEIPAETIRRITKEFVDAAGIGNTIIIDGIEFRYRQAVYCYSKSYSGSRGMHTQSAGKLTNVLIGGNNTPGGWSGTEADLTINPADGLTLIEATEAYHGIGWPPEKATYAQDNRESDSWGTGLYPMMYNMNTLAWFAINDPEKYALQHPCEVYSFCGANILGNSFSPPFIAEQMAKIPFIYGMSLVFDDVANMCDVLLPPDTHLDGCLRTMAIGAYTRTEPPGVIGVGVQHPVVPRTYNTMNGDDILIELAERIGILYGEKGLNSRLNRGLGDEYKIDVDKKYTFEDIFDRQLKSDYGADRGLDWFKEHGWLTEELPGAGEQFRDLTVPGSRYRLYLEDLVWAKYQYRKELEEVKQQYGVELRPSNEFVLDYYRPYPDYMVRPYEELPAEYDMYAIHYKTLLQAMATFMTNPWIEDVVRTVDPYAMYIMIHPQAAAKRGIKNGDVIWAESPFGKTKAEASVTELIRSDTIAMAGLFGATSVSLPAFTREGPLFNNLCWADENWRDPLSGNQENGMKVKVYKA
jgi:anaerobic selenocysteine-containing dehydrogenase